MSSRDGAIAATSRISSVLEDLLFDADIGL
jgi:hypothetical protein